MVYLGMLLGLRWGEVAGLRVGRIDFLAGTITVAEQLTRGEGGRAVAGLGGLTFHDLRRAAATALVLENADLKTAQSRLGHSDPPLTLGLYAQASSEADRDAADRVGERFLPRAWDGCGMERDAGS